MKTPTSSPIPDQTSATESHQTQQRLERAKSELVMFAEITNAMQRSLDMYELFYIILTAITAHEGLRFNRAMLFLVDEEQRMLEGVMGIGPKSGVEAHKIWSQIESDQLGLDDLIDVYQAGDQALEGSPLNQQVQRMQIPLREESGIVALTALQGRPIELASRDSRDRVRDTYLDVLAVDECVTVPLKSRDRVLGIILADNPFTHHPIDRDDVRLLTMFANQAGLAIENSRLYEAQVELANRDSLTRLWNHGYFQHSLGLIMEQAADSEESIALILLDLDDFKLYNDRWGHPTGDRALREIASLLHDMSRHKDIVARYGGEEFVIVLQGTSKEKAAEVANRQLERLAQHEFKTPENTPTGHLTASAGIAVAPIDAHTKDDLIQKADEALYRAKTAGKSQVALA